MVNERKSVVRMSTGVLQRRALFAEFHISLFLKTLTGYFHPTRRSASFFWILL